VPNSLFVCFQVATKYSLVSDDFYNLMHQKVLPVSVHRQLELVGGSVARSVLGPSLFLIAAVFSSSCRWLDPLVETCDRELRSSGKRLGIQLEKIYVVMDKSEMACFCGLSAVLPLLACSFLFHSVLFADNDKKLEEVTLKMDDDLLGSSSQVDEKNNSESKQQEVQLAISENASSSSSSSFESASSTSSSSSSSSESTPTSPTSTSSAPLLRTATSSPTPLSRTTTGPLPTLEQPQKLTSSSKQASKNKSKKDAYEVQRQVTNFYKEQNPTQGAVWSCIGSSCFCFASFSSLPVVHTCLVICRRSSSRFSSVSHDPRYSRSSGELACFSFCSFARYVTRPHPMLVHLFFLLESQPYSSSSFSLLPSALLPPIVRAISTKGEAYNHYTGYDIAIFIACFIVTVIFNSVLFLYVWVGVLDYYRRFALFKGVLLFSPSPSFSFFFLILFFVLLFQSWDTLSTARAPRTTCPLSTRSSSPSSLT
jgi:hypothetical protein